MIMAGRGRRLEASTEEQSKMGTPPVSPDSKPVDLPTLVNKITEINMSDVNLSLMLNVRSMFKQLFTSKEAMRDVLSEVHTKALADADFGDKAVFAMEHISNFEIDGTLLRGELLSFIQNDFKDKETTFKSDKKKFINSVLLLGNVYHRFKVCGEPIVVLGIALMEYFDLLMKGEEEEELKVLIKQILINGSKLLQVKNYENLIQNLRSTLINSNINATSKCYILLAIDFMSNNLRPLKGAIKDFYVKNLGEEYTKLESCIPVQNEALKSPVSLNSAKSPDSTSLGSKGFNFSPNKADSHKKDLSKKFSNMSVKSGNLHKDKTPGKSNKKDMWKSSGGDKGMSGHDDRFDKEEDFYGAQKPRQPKPFNPKKKFNDAKVTKIGDDDSKTDMNKVELQLETSENKVQN